MLALVRTYARWLHTRWPAGTVERLPYLREDGSTNVPGVLVVGDLTGIPLLKFSSDTGARAVRRIVSEPAFQNRRRGSAAGRPPLDLVIIGAGVSGMAAALQALKANLTFEVIEATEPFSTIVNFPRGKPIYTYPTGMTPAGELQFSAKSAVKEGLVVELRETTLARGLRPRIGRAEMVRRRGGLLETHLAGGETLVSHRVIVAIGRSGNFRRLGVAGEDLDKVYNRLHDPKDYADRDVLVVGGGDSALETALAIAECGGRVTLSYRKSGLSRPKPDNLERIRLHQAEPASAGGSRDESRRGGSLRVALGSQVKAILPSEVVLAHAGGREERLPNDAVFTMIGREAPLDFFRRSGIRIAGELRAPAFLAMGCFLLFCAWLYNWKSGGWMSDYFAQRGWFPFNLPSLLADAGGWIATEAADPATLVGTVSISAAGPSFWYTLAYSLVVVVFGLRRIRKRRTPYVTAQTLTLMTVQVVPLFLLPEVILPLMGRHGLLPAGLADALFPAVSYGHGREYWRAYGLILAWPLNVYNIFTHEPLWWWIGIGFVQTCVLIPLGIYFYGKGVYCGWICSCGALAETLGDEHRHKMPHGPSWSRLNMIGQGILAVAIGLLGVRIAGWALPEGNAADRIFDPVLKTHYKWFVDVFLAGVVGYGLYFWYSGRIWCRFACPLAALMHVYARFSRFRILSDKKKCISCNVCTTVCHQGIDVMNFANKGLPMADPECVRCSACVQSCPTGTLTFGQVDPSTLLVIRRDRLAASPVLMAEGAAK
ncbi:MAG TPA: NAD(P)-binding domain-containing protein [Candidatus Polarisedimenticolia bacterium]|jgi:thioredoxin reductase/ferredoxin